MNLPAKTAANADRTSQATQAQSAKNFESELIEQVNAFMKSKGVEGGAQIAAMIESVNSQNRALIRELGKLANNAVSSFDPDRVNAARELALKFKIAPAMQENLANFFKPKIGESYRILRSVFHTIGLQSRIYPWRTLGAKTRAKHFAASVGLRVPQVYQLAVPHHQVNVAAAVVKPAAAAGGAGAHAFVAGPNGLIDLFANAKSYADIEEVRRCLKSHLSSGLIKSDEWIVEELILPASGRIADSRDIKIFTFYGEIGYVLQVDRWSEGGPRRAMFRPDGTPVEVSNFYGLPKSKIEPAFTPDDLKLAQEVSRKIPWPGVRIDFLNSANGLVLGEFTLNPGAFAAFHDESDHYFGQLWVDATARLYEDMLNGKPFSEYRDFVGSID
jgi:hypothetical protein